MDSFQDHITWFFFFLSVPNWLLSRPFEPILLLCTQIDSFQDHITWFYVLFIQLTPFKTIWPNFIIVYPIDSFQNHLT